MKWLWTGWKLNSLKTIGVIIGAIMIVLVSLPMVALASITNIIHVDDPGNSLYTGPGNTADTYAWGNCTYWVSLKRIEDGHPIPNTWGNANTWSIRAALDGYWVDHSPAVGSIMQTSAGQFGHVGYVVDVDQATGKWTVSEMNVMGLDIVDQHTYNRLDALFYNFIH